MSTFDTLADGEYTVVVDTIEEGLATVFLEQNGKEVTNAVIDAKALPVDARHADAILTSNIADGEFDRLRYDPERTKTRKQDAQDRFDRLSSRPSDDDASI